MRKRHLFFTILFFICIAMNSFAGGRNMRDELNKISDSEKWKYMVCDGYSIDLYNLPFTKFEKRLFEVENRSLMRIGNRKLSPDEGKIAFTLETYGSPGYRDMISLDLYTVDTNTSNLVKLTTGSLKNVFLMTFLGNDKLLFENSESENYRLKPGTRIFYTVDLNTNEIVKFSNQEVNINFTIVSSDGDLLVYSEHGGFVVYAVTEKTSRKINIDGDRPVLSPDGQQILFRRGGMTGDYYIIDESGSAETLVLSRGKISGLLKGSGDYRDLHFASWSPDSKFILLLESSDLQKNRAFILDIQTKEILEVTGS